MERSNRWAESDLESVPKPPWYRPTSLEAGFLLAYTAAMFIFYTMASIVYRLASSVFYHLILITANLFGLLFGTCQNHPSLLGIEDPDQYLRSIPIRASSFRTCVCPPDLLIRVHTIDRPGFTSRRSPSSSPGRFVTSGPPHVSRVILYKPPFLLTESQGKVYAQSSRYVHEGEKEDTTVENQV